MTIERIKPDKFIEKSEEILIFDTRSPGEFQKGHISGAINLPLFNNDERAEIGTLYKQKGNEAAVMRGLEIVGPKLTEYIKTVKSHTENKEILLHCWRGGMRSGSMAWLLETVGFKIFVLEGGYKAYRNYIRSEFEKKSKGMVILGGMTGSGKTDILFDLEEKGEQIIDLEGLACHKGSAFGTIGMSDQPSNEQFENDLFDKWKKLNPDRTIWIEDESIKIGRVEINDPFFQQMREAPLLKILVNKEVRAKRLAGEYCIVSKEELITPIRKISRRLGGLKEKEAVEHIENGDFEKAIWIVLDYYDKGYLHGNSKRDQSKVFEIEIKNYTVTGAAEILINFMKENYSKIRTN